MDVTAVYYDEIDHIEVGDVVTVKICSLPFRIRFKRTLYHLGGSRECGTNELEVSQNGVIATTPVLGPDGPAPVPLTFLEEAAMTTLIDGIMTPV